MRSKFIKPLIVFIAYEIFFIFFFLIVLPPFAGRNISPLVFGKGAIELILIYVVFWPLAAFIGTSILSHIILPLYIFFHKKIIGRNLKYGIEEVKSSDKFNKYFRGFFPSLMAINFSLFFASNENMISLVLNIDQFIVIPDPIMRSITIYLFTFFILLTPMIAISMALFTPVWYLLDAGIVYSNKSRILENNKDEPLEARTLGNYYYYFLKGYAGISTIFSYYLLVLNFFRILVPTNREITTSHFLYIVVNSMIFFPLIFLITISILPTVMFMELSKSLTRRYVRGMAKKMGIKKRVEIQFIELD